jgi:hypothetical protein
MGDIMKTAYVVRLSVSVLLLAVVGSGAVLHAHDRTPATNRIQHESVAAKTAPEDVDLVGVVGDVLIDGCTTGDARCSKAWKDLGQLADKPAL